MKRRIIAIITAVLLFSLLAFSASAAGSTATTETKSCAQGGTVTVGVTLSSTSGVTSGAVEVIYDNTKLQLLDGSWNTPGALLSSFDKATNKGAFAYQTGNTVSGKIFSVSFKVLDGASVGDTDVQCKIQLKNGSTDLPVTNAVGKISITCKHNFTKQDTTYPASPASCTSAASYYYSCTICGEKGNNTFTVGSPTSHVYDKEVNTEEYLVAPVTCADTAEFFTSCVCGAKGNTTFTAEAAFSHRYSESWLVGKDGHWHGCLNCDSRRDYSGHEGEICSVCSFVTEDGHFHVFGTEYKKDSGGHWYECTCGEKKDHALHMMDEVDGKGECTVCGYTTQITSITPIVPGGSNELYQDVIPADFIEKTRRENDLTVAIVSAAGTLVAAAVVELIVFAIVSSSKKKNPE